MEIEGLHPELNLMLARGQLSGRKILDLLRLREFVDALAASDYVPAKEKAELKQRFGVEPEIQSWADYFQTEIASRYFELSDKEFSKIIDTIRFDLIAAKKIFQGKAKAFHAEVRENGLAAYAKPSTEWSTNDEENAHLYILEQYFTEMQLGKKSLTKEEEEWFSSFTDTEVQAQNQTA